MFRVLALLFVVLLVAGAIDPVGAVSPIFTKTWGGTNNDYGSGAAVDLAGNIIVTGMTGSFGSGAFLLKYSGQGSLVWQKAWTSNIPMSGRAVAVDPSRNVYVTGSLGGVIGSEALIAKVNSTGGLVWQKSWATSSVGSAVALDSLGEVYVTGAYSNALMLLKFSSSGSRLWQRTWPGNYSTGGTGVAMDASDSVYVTGTMGSASLLLKFNSTGNLDWQRVWRVAGNTTLANGITIDPSGGIYLAGSNLSSPEGPLYAFVTKFSSDGALLWEKAWPGSPRITSASADAIDADAFGNIYVTGSASYNIFLLEINSTGSLVSAISWGGGSEAYSIGIALDNAGIPAIVGYILGSPSRNGPLGADRNLRTELPLQSTPGIAAQNATDFSSNFTAALIDVNGSTKYAGGYDVFLNYGSTFPISVPILAQTQIIALVATTTIAVRLKYRRRQNLPHSHIFVPRSESYLVPRELAVS